MEGAGPEDTSHVQGKGGGVGPEQDHGGRASGRLGAGGECGGPGAGARQVGVSLPSSPYRTHPIKPAGPRATWTTDAVALASPWSPRS